MRLDAPTFRTACLGAILGTIIGAAPASAACPDGTPPFTLIDSTTATRIAVVGRSAGITRTLIRDPARTRSTSPPVAESRYRGLLPISSFNVPWLSWFRYSPDPARLFPLVPGTSARFERESLMRDNYIADLSVVVAVGETGEVTIGDCRYGVTYVELIWAYAEPQRLAWSEALETYLDVTLRSRVPGGAPVPVFRADAIRPGIHLEGDLP